MVGPYPIISYIYQFNSYTGGKFPRSFISYIHQFNSYIGRKFPRSSISYIIYSTVEPSSVGRRFGSRHYSV